MTSDDAVNPGGETPGRRSDRRAGHLPAGLRELLVRRWLKRLAHGQLTVNFPSGFSATYGGREPGPQATVTIRDIGLTGRIVASGDLGFAEAYIAGEWDTPDLAAVLTLMARNAADMKRAWRRSWLTTTLNRVRHWRRANTPTGSRRNIAAHYDLGNDFYALWLDESMTYSSAVFTDAADSLIDAQRRKNRQLATALDLQPGHRVLEIGCGWGGFAEMAAAEFGCSVTGITLSVEQARYARERIAHAGLSDKVDIRIQDYREVEGQFDRIASIEMFEAVGEAHWPSYFNAVRRALAPNGKAALQIITIADGVYQTYRRNPDFIQRYIFPGGMLPSEPVLEDAVNAAALRIADRLPFGRSYAETLRRWALTFEARWPDIERQGFDQRFRRMWRYYLAYCEVGFDLGQIDVAQYAIARA